MQKNYRYLYIALLSSIAIYLIALFKFNTTGIGDLGTFGDFIGGSLNPILSFLSFLILIQTIRYQHDALETSKKELELTRKELERSADTQEDLQKVQEQQAKTQILQQFENTFFSLLAQIKTVSLDQEQVRFLLGSSFSGKNIIDARIRFQREKEKHSHFFRLIYQTLKFLESKEKFDKSIDIYFYKNIFRSTLSPNTTILLGLNSAIAPKFKELDQHIEYKRLIEKFSLLQHMPFRLDINGFSNSYLNSHFLIVQMLGCYESKAFENNINYKYLLKEDENIIDKMIDIVKKF